MKRTIRIKRQFQYPLEVVWQAISNPVSLGEWFMPNDFKPELNFEFTFRKPPQKGWDGITWCKVTEYVPLHLVAYTYRGKASGEKTLACAGIKSETGDKVVKGIFTELDTVLKFTLSPSGSGTEMILEHSGFKGFKLVIVSMVMGMGWKKLVDSKLPQALEKISNQSAPK
jgi:uncharacterized protein YndB with AHSA1/START domain